jgi:hypothetical protein
VSGDGPVGMTRAEARGREPESGEEEKRAFRDSDKGKAEVQRKDNSIIHIASNLCKYVTCASSPHTCSTASSRSSSALACASAQATHAIVAIAISASASAQATHAIVAIAISASLTGRATITLTLVMVATGEAAPSPPPRLMPPSPPHSVAAPQSIMARMLTVSWAR